MIVMREGGTPGAVAGPGGEPMSPAWRRWNYQSSF